MDHYDPVELLEKRIEQLEKGKEFARAEEKIIADAVMVSKSITLLEQTDTFNKYIR